MDQQQFDAQGSCRELRLRVMRLEDETKNLRKAVNDNENRSLLNNQKLVTIVTAISILIPAVVTILPNYISFN